MERIFFNLLLLIVGTTFQVKSQENSPNNGTPASKSSIPIENLESEKIIIKNLSKTINTSFDEYASVISADGLMLMFTSNHPIREEDVKKGKQGMENIYVSYINETTKKWGEAGILATNVNQPDRNNSAIALSNDGQRMLLYRGDPDGNIYESVLKGSEWSVPVKLPKPINSKQHESSASIAPDGRTIYFVSNRKGGQGGLDIWVSHQNSKGNWEKAENLGPVVNSSKNEEGVFIHPDGKTLYFSSKGHDSKGGYDIFKSVLENGKWSIPVSLGDSINTPNDDLFFVLTADGKTGYYSSVRDGGIGKKDIYEINFSYFKKKKNEPRLTLFKGVVIDNETHEPIAAEIEIIDNVKNEFITSIKANSSTGKFLISLPAGKNYGIAVKRKGYLFYSENFNIPDSAAFKVIDKLISLQKLIVGNKIILKNIFYDYGKATLRGESVSELNQLVKLMNLNKDIKIEIASFTDSEGTNEFNLNLLQERAQSVVDFLINSNINNKRLIAKGYGEAMPIATNATEEGRQLNRRTEFKILNK